jgi:hypothetical protein
MFYHNQFNNSKPDNKTLDFDAGFPTSFYHADSKLVNVPSSDPPVIDILVLLLSVDYIT